MSKISFMCEGRKESQSVVLFKMALLLERTSCCISIFNTDTARLYLWTFHLPSYRSACSVSFAINTSLSLSRTSSAILVPEETTLRQKSTARKRRPLFEERASTWLITRPRATPISFLLITSLFHQRRDRQSPSFHNCSCKWKNLNSFPW